MEIKSILKDKLLPLNVEESKLIEHLKKEWTDIEIKGVETIVFNQLRNAVLIDSRGNKEFMTSMKKMSNFFQLAYTSSGRFAILNACNKFYIDVEEKIALQGFCIRNTSDIILCCEDDSGQEYYFFFKYDFEY